VYNNNVIRNRIGVLLSNHAGTLGTGNRVYNNNFMSNEENAIVEHAYLNLSSLDDSYYEVSGNGTDAVSWDNGWAGNYWSDYNGQGAYVIDENNVDHHPLTQQVDVSTTAPTELATLLAIATIVVAVAMCAALVFYFKKRKP
jgi:hypothetical protein